MVRNMKDGNRVTVNIGIGWILFFIFLTLKLTDTISWSWWWVTSPLWIPVAASAVIAILAVIHLIKK
jgi:hypothetical protein